MTPKPFNKLQATGITKNNVTIAARKLSSEESSYYFGADMSKKTGWFTQGAEISFKNIFYTKYPPYHAIHVVIKNKSQDAYVFNGNDVSLPLEPYNNVWAKIRACTIPEVVDPGSYLYWVSCFDRTAKDIKNKLFDRTSSVIIKPCGRLNKFLFVPKSSDISSFSITLCNETNKEKDVFDLAV